MKVKAKLEAPLPDYYKSTDEGAAWNLYCKGCGRGWVLRKSGNSSGNVLKLLDHARSHEKKGGIIMPMLEDSARNADANYVDVEEIMRWEGSDGENPMSDDETIDMFQRLINSGLVWRLQGCYGRAAAGMIDAGLCSVKGGDNGSTKLVD